MPDLCYLPYENCWFEFTVTDELLGFVIVAIMATRLDDNTRAFQVYMKIKKQWRMVNVSIKAGDNIDNFINDPYSAVYHHSVDAFLSAMNCTNVHRQENIPDPKLQKSRANKGKKPLFSFWTLHLNGRSEHGQPKGGTHASPRLHLRCGHIRRYLSGKAVFIQPCIVGNKAAGMVHKDYAVGPTFLKSKGLATQK